MPDEDGIMVTKRIVNQLDKYLKTMLLNCAFSIIMDKPDVEDNVFEKIFPPKDIEKYSKLTVYNDSRVIFEMLAGFKRPDHISLSQFCKLAGYPDM